MAYKSEDYEGQLAEWASKYNAYDQIAKDAEELDCIPLRLHQDWVANRRIVDWAGVDIPRAWVSHFVRQHRWSGWDPLLVECPQVHAIGDHPCTKKRDMPPAQAWFLGFRAIVDQPVLRLLCAPAAVPVSSPEKPRLCRMLEGGGE